VWASPSTINHQQSTIETMVRIPIIDDDVKFLKMFRQMLERAGHEVIEAPNGEVGTKLFREMRPELMITDIFMPGKEGIETIRELGREFPMLKIIAISGGGRKGEFSFLEMAEALGADRSFSKPFERQEMLTAIQELVAR
jgi:CheY-like chemotaxis protein